MKNVNVIIVNVTTHLLWQHDNEGMLPEVHLSDFSICSVFDFESSIIIYKSVLGLLLLILISICSKLCSELIQFLLLEENYFESCAGITFSFIYALLVVCCKHVYFWH